MTATGSGFEGRHRSDVLGREEASQDCPCEDDDEKGIMIVELVCSTWDSPRLPV